MTIPGVRTHSIATAFLVLVALLMTHPQHLTAHHPPQETLDLRGNPEIERVIDGARDEIEKLMNEQDLPGLAIALVDRDGIVWAEGFGTTERDGGRPVDTGTMFSIQSMSKTVSATGVLAGVRDGLVDLDEPITTYLSEFTVNSPYEENPERHMTLRHLLSHRAGFTHEAPMGNNYDPSFPSWDQYIRSISDTWLRYPVGERFSYSNLGVDLAGYILQTVSGKRFPDYMAERVFEPLGLVRSSMDWKVIREDRNRAVGHSEGYDEVPLEHGLIPSGGFYGSVEDVAEFVRFHLNEGHLGDRQIIPRSILREMYSIQFPREGQIQGYGLGLGQYLRYGDYVYSHSGGGFGFLSHMSWYPQFGVGIVVLTNSTDHNLTSGIPGELMNRVIQATIGEVPGEILPYDALDPVEIDHAQKHRLVGNYIGRGFRVLIELDDQGHATVRMRGQTAPLRFLSPEEAFSETENGRRLFRFSLDDGGRPVSLQIVNDGQSFDFNGGPNDLPGPNEPEWSTYEGEYTFTVWGQRTVSNDLHRQNGYLYFRDLRLQEHLPGLFFSSTGEALDLRGSVPTWRNIRLTKVSR